MKVSQYLIMNTRTMFYGSQRITFENARRLRKEMTEAERILWGCLSKKQMGGVRFRKQHPIGDYIADFYCHEFKLVIEVDGPIHEQREYYDAERTHALATVGLKVIRFSNSEVLFDIESVVEKIQNVLKK